MPEERHESQEPSLRGLSVAGFVLIAAIIVAVAVCLGLVHLFGGFSRPLARAEHSVMPEPHLQPHPLADRATYEARQRATLTQYAWVDRGAGIVRIPIGRAMQILAERGRAGAFQRGHLTCPRSGERTHTDVRAGEPAAMDGQWHCPTRRLP
ncbi:MAG TPA: hypothetical protein VFW10_14570 [Steroidobacteraceae bacterium]|nr:hypothetical protein [Steroidobacteraceae bacterium]